MISKLSPVILHGQYSRHNYFAMDGFITLLLLRIFLCSSKGWPHMAATQQANLDPHSTSLDHVTKSRRTPMRRANPRGETEPSWMGQGKVLQ